MTNDPGEAIIEALTRPSGRPQTTGQSLGGWQSVRVTGGPFASARRESIQFLKERSAGSHRLYAVSYVDEEGHDHLDFVGVVQGPDSSWTRSGSAGGSGKRPERDRPWVNFGGWWGPNIFAAGGHVIGTDAEPARRVELVFGDGTTLGDSVDSGLVLFIEERTLQPPATARIP
ncbi:MAG TPA: hypothetical protein VFV02_09450, partial [Acidimicrobiales bacterium]|nr:hypothetical protein [Acidimicrobiales bacterium]